MATVTLTIEDGMKDALDELVSEMGVSHLTAKAGGFQRSLVHGLNV